MRLKTGLKIQLGEWDIPVVIDDNGEFWAEWEGDSYQSTTFKGLRAKLLPVVRLDLKRVEIPALIRSGGEWEPITLVGLHAGNDNALYLDAKGATHQVRAYGTGDIYPVLSPRDRAEHARLMDESKRASKKLNDWLTKRVLKPGAVIRTKLGLPPEPPKKRSRWDIDDDEDLT